MDKIPPIIPRDELLGEFNNSLIDLENASNFSIHSIFQAIKRFFGCEHSFYFRYHESYKSISLISSDMDSFDASQMDSGLISKITKSNFDGAFLENFGNINDCIYMTSRILSDSIIPNSTSILVFLHKDLVQINETYLNSIYCSIKSAIKMEKQDPHFIISHVACFLEKYQKTIKSHLFEVDSYDEDTLFKFLVSIFFTDSLLTNLGIDVFHFIRFLIRIQKHYFSVPYHNWYHVIDATQYVYCFVHSRKLDEKLNNIDIFALYFSTICHDIEHDGRNNAFHIQSNSPYFQLSGSNNPPLELHHADKSLNLLIREYPEVLQNLSEENRNEFIHFVIQIILATDMSKHNHFLLTFSDISKTYDPSNVDHRLILCQISMKSADLSNTVRPFNEASIMAKKLRNEWFLQGDSEKDLGFEITKGFDRYKCDSLAQSQIGFYRFVALPLMEKTHLDFVSCPKCISEFNHNLKKWEDLNQNDND